jgi:hypothetical protein
MNEKSEIPKYIIAVIGTKSFDAFPSVEQLSEEIGEQIALHACWLICGGTTGVMEAAPRGAKRQSGFTIGIVPKLDFIHLRASAMHNGRQWYTNNLLQPKGDCHGAFAFRRARGDCKLCAPVFQTGFRACQSADRRGHLGPEETHGDVSITGDG